MRIENYEKNNSKTIHDKAYTHLKELVDEIREAGNMYSETIKTG